MSLKKSLSESDSQMNILAMACKDDVLLAEVSVPFLSRADAPELHALAQVRIREPFLSESRLVVVDASRLRAP